MKALGDYIHDRDLKFGIYSDAGFKTCGRMAGSLGFESQDLDQFLSYGIDYLKYDNCYPVENQANHMGIMASLTHIPSLYQDPHEQTRFDPMGEAVLEARRTIGINLTFELCLYGWGNVENWGYKYGSLWRTSGDIRYVSCSN